MAQEAGGRFLLRIEDIDRTRCRPEYEHAIYEDLEWLGLEWETPVRRQSEHFDDYKAALEKLNAAGLAYPSFLSRREAEAFPNTVQRDPQGALLHPPAERKLDSKIVEDRIAAGEPYALRLNMDKAAKTIPEGLSWTELSPGHANTINADFHAWGDVVIARKETPTSYHLSVVVDDALQGVTHVVRGMDLFEQTAIHRLLQTLLDLPEPHYFHHRLITGDDGGKLAKSASSLPLHEMRGHGVTAPQIRRILGF